MLFEKMFTVYLRRETCAFFSQKITNFTVSIVNKLVNNYVALYGIFLYLICVGRLGHTISLKATNGPY